MDNLLNIKRVCEIEGVASSTAWKRVAEVKEKLGKDEITLFDYLKARDYDAKNVCFLFGAKVANNYKEACELGI